MQRICDIDLWAVIDPIASQNKVRNPSAETTGNFAARNAAAITRSTTWQWRGLYSYRVQTSLPDEGIHITLSALSNTVHYTSMMVYGRLPSLWQWSLDNSNWRSPKRLKSDNGAVFYGAVFPASQASGSTILYVRQASGGETGDFYLDAVQVEPHSFWTTYIDGDQDGCIWDAAAHASASTRTSQARAGGRVRPIASTYDVAVSAWHGTGMAPIDPNISGQALLPGAVLQSVKVEPRPLQFTFEVPAVYPRDIQERVKKLIDVFKPNRVTPAQPLRLRYTGADKEVEIVVDYDTGLEGEFEWKKYPTIPVRFIAYEDPYFHEIKEQVASLTTKQELINANYILKKINGTWSELASGALTSGVYDIAISPIDGTVYIAGNFTNVGGDANADYIVSYDPNTDTFSSLGTGTNALVRAVACAPNGDVYIGGDFTNQGDANGDYIARWTPSTSTWSSLSATVLNAAVRSLAFGPDGKLYIGGSFFNVGDANGDYIISWDGSNFASLGLGVDAPVYGVAVDSANNVYIGGLFTAASGVANTDNLAKWTGSAWVSVTGGTVNSNGLGVLVVDDGTVYFSGQFGIINGVVCAMIAKYTGSQILPLGAGLTGGGGGAYRMAFSNGLLYVTGNFTTAGGLTLADRVAIWNGYSWLHIDCNLPGTPDTQAVAIDGDNKIYLGYTTAGTAYTSAITTVNNPGTTNAYPKLVIARSGGTSARLEWLKNETSGKVCWFNYSLQDGETIEIDFTPGSKAITSNIFGNIMGRALLPGSDFATWSLQPDDNDISFYISDAGNPTLTAYFKWFPRHWGVEGVM